MSSNAGQTGETRDAQQQAGIIGKGRGREKRDSLAGLSKIGRAGLLTVDVGLACSCGRRFGGGAGPDRGGGLKEKIHEAAGRTLCQASNLSQRERERERQRQSRQNLTRAKIAAEPVKPVKWSGVWDGMCERLGPGGLVKVHLSITVSYEAPLSGLLASTVPTRQLPRLDPGGSKFTTTSSFRGRQHWVEHGPLASLALGDPPAVRVDPGDVVDPAFFLPSRPWMDG